MTKKVLIFVGLAIIYTLLTATKLNADSPELNLRKVLTLAEKLNEADVISDDSKQLLAQWAQKRFAADSVELPENMDIATSDGLLFFCGWRRYLDMLEEEKTVYGKILKSFKSGEAPTEEQAEAFKRMREPKEFVEMTLSPQIANDSPPVEAYAKPLKKYFDKLSKRLIELGLIDERLRSEVEVLLKEKGVNLEYEILGLLAHRKRFYRTYPILKAEQIALFNALEEKGALASGGTEKLAASYKDFKFLYAFDIMPHMAKSHVVELNPAENLRASYLRAMKEVAPMVTGFQTQGLNLEIQRKEDRGMLAMFHIIFTYKIRGVIQRKIIATGLDKESLEEGEKLENQVMGIVSDWSPVDEVFNHVLTETGSSYRMFSMPNTSIYETPTAVGFFMMNKASYDLWDQAREDDVIGIGMLSDVSFDKRLSSSGRRRLAVSYRRMGLLNHMSETAYRNAARQAAKGYATDLQEVLSSFPDVVYEFESSNFATMEPYKELIEGMGEVSKKAFITTEVIDNYEAVYAEDEDSLIVHFTFKDSTYQVPLKYEADEIDLSIIDYVNQIMEAWNRKGRFYLLRDGGVAYFTTNQYNFLKKDQAELFKEEEIE